MDSPNNDLLSKIQAFDFDAGEKVTLSFEKKLAREQGWSRDFARRAIQEYRRFAYLACVAGHPVGPSDAVDQVWHQHLTYTHSYWVRFCNQTLETPLHHHPTKGGTTENRRHFEMYEATLSSYRRIFGEEPPADLWPAVQVRFGRDLQFRRVNTATHWVVPKISLRRVATSGSLATVMLLTLGGCAGPVFGVKDPFGIEGIDFLLVWGVILIGTIALIHVLLDRFRKPDAEPGMALPELSTDDKAFLAGGNLRVVDTALLELHQRGLLVAAETKGQVKAVEGTPPEDLLRHALYQIVYEAPERTIAVIDLHRKVETLLKPRKQRMIEQGLIVPDRVRFRGILVFMLLLTPVFGMGIVRLIIGAINSRPVGFLIVEMVLGFIVSVLLISRWVSTIFRTRRGDHVLEVLTEEHRFTESRTRDRSPEMVAAGMALAGTAVLAGTTYEPFGQKLHKPNSSGDASSSGGCTSGSDGGGCGGGGGGCGGGCGGCGGGD